MSINAVSEVAQTHQKAGAPSPAVPSAGTTPFGQQLDEIRTTQTLAARVHQHHHQSSASQASAGTPASAGHAGTASGTLGSLLALLS